MPYTYDPYDPDELRRRQLLSPEMDGPQPVESSPSSPGANAVMAEDPDEEPASPQSAAAPGMTDAQKSYRQTLDSMPNRANYKPSKWRRFGAALAGGLAGMKDAKSGMQVAQTIVGAPYDQAQQDWASQVNKGALSMGLDKDVAAQDIARQRAAAYGQSAQARMDVAKSTEAWRQHQMANEPWHPHSEEEATRFEQSKHVPQKPTAFEQYMNDPDGYRNYLKDVNAGKTQPLTYEQRRSLLSISEGGRNSRNAANIAARKNGAQKPIMASPRDQQAAEDQAVQQLLRTNPEYAASVDTPTTHQGGFLGMGGSTVKGKPRVRSMEEVAQGKTGAEGSLARALHAKFLSELDKRKQAILGASKNPNSPGQSDWDIQEEDDQ